MIDGMPASPTSTKAGASARDVLPLLNSGSIVLPRSDRLVAQLVALERRTTRAGRDSIDHAPNGHDDLYAVAGAADAVVGNHNTGHTVASWGGPVYWRSNGEQQHEPGVINEQSAPDTAIHPQPKEVDEKWFKVLREDIPRIW